MTEHTPGPWLVRDWRDKPKVIHEGGGSPFTIGSPGGVHVASLPNHNKADARLIAAAPDLLDTLLRAVQDIDSGWDDDAEERFPWLQDANAAIAKALGQEASS